MERIKEHGAALDPRKICACFCHNGVFGFFPDLLHLLKNLRTRLMLEGDIEGVRFLSFFIDMK